MRKFCDTVCSHLYVESKKAKLIEIENRFVVARRWEGGGSGEILVESYKLPAVRWISSGDLMHSLMTIINSTALCLKVFKRIDLKCYYHTHTQMIIMWGDGGVN